MGFLDNAGTEMLWEKIKSKLANYLPLTGGTMKGLLKVPYGTAVHYTTGTEGSSGYVHLATIVIKTAYTNVPIELTITRRSDNQPTKIVVQFLNENSADPALQTFSVMGTTDDVWMYKSATSTWELYVGKSEKYDCLGVTDLQKSEYLDDVSITWQNDQVSTLPGGSVQATVREFLGIASESKKSDALADTGSSPVTASWYRPTLTYDTCDYMAAWTGHEIRTIKKQEFARSNHTHGEATLTWGGKNWNGNVGPVGAALSAEHSANRLAFINGDALTVEYSKDGGTTWSNYGLTAAQKSWFCTGYQDILIGRTNGSEKYTTDSKTRITIFAQPYFYTNPKKLLVNMRVSAKTELLIEYKQGTENAEWKTYGTADVSGWSGWNDVDLQLFTLGGDSGQTGNYWYLRLTFSMKSVNEDYATTAYVRGLRLFGPNNWGSASENAGKGSLSSTGHVYSYDADANVSFPGLIAEKGQYLQDKYQQKGILTMKNDNEIRFEKPAWDTAKSMYFGYAWDDGSREALIKGYIFENGASALADITANIFHGTLEGTAWKVKDDSEGTADAMRHVWFSGSDVETKRNHDDKFTYNPATKMLNVGGFTYTDKNGYRSDIVILPSVPYQAIDETHEDRTYYKELLKWICTNYPNRTSVIFVGSACPNSANQVSIRIYDTNKVNSEGYPEYACGMGMTLNGRVIVFGCTSYNYYFNSASMDGHSHTKASLGLGNVDNTADSEKSVKYAASAGSASKVNGHTVNADVPSDAEFTDTTYSVFRGTEGMSDGTSGLVPAPKASEFGNSYALGSDGNWKDFGQTFVSQSFADGAYATNEALENAVKEIKKYVDTQSSGGVTLDSVYPVGSIYISVNDSFNPNNVFPGTWVSFGKGRTLVGVDRSDLEFQSSEDTGGEKTHTLTVDELPAHNHSVTIDSKELKGSVWNFVGQNANYAPGNSTSGVFSKGGDGTCFYPSATGKATGINDGFAMDATHDHTATSGNTGSGTAHNNMPPYITVYMWKRTE